MIMQIHMIPMRAMSLRVLTVISSTLDVTKAVSDLDKDKVLQQYQRFVGSADVTVMQQAALNEQINRETENFYTMSFLYPGEYIDSTYKHRF